MLQRRKAMLERGYQPLNAGREPVVNRFLMFCNKAKLKHLLRGLVVWLVSSSLLISYIFKRRGCVGADVTFPNCVLLVLSMLIGGGGPEISQTDCCPALNVAASAISFLTDSMVIAVFVNRITSPKAVISVSDVVLLKMRNNRLLLQIRIMNEFGHPLQNVTVNACYYRISVSEEGERFTNIVPIEFECNFVCHFPQNVSHFIDETSPFYGEELEDFVGTLEVTVSGHDPVLGASTSSTMFYDKTVVQVAHEWESVFVRPPGDTVDGELPIVDNSKLSVTVSAPEELAAKIHDAISWNKFNRDIGATSVPSVLKTLHGGKPRVHNIGNSERYLLNLPRDRSQVLKRTLSATQATRDRPSRISDHLVGSPVSLNADASEDESAETNRKKTALGFSALFRHRHKHR